MQLHELMVSDLCTELSDQEQEVVAGGADYTQPGPPQYNGYGPLGLFGPGGLYGPGSQTGTIPGYSGSFSGFGPSAGAGGFGGFGGSTGSSGGFGGFGSFGA